MALLALFLLTLFVMISPSQGEPLGHLPRALLQAPASGPSAPSLTGSPSPNSASAASAPAVQPPPPAARSVPNATLGDTEEYFTVGTQAYIWGYPLVVFWKLLGVGSPLTGGSNKLLFATQLSTSASRAVVSPNVDTLYGSATFYLPGNSTLVLSHPNFGSRYFSFAFIDAYSNNFFVAGTRATGGNASNFALVGPSFSGTLPTNVTKVQSPTPYGIVIARYLVYNSSDVSNVLALQNATRLVPLSQFLGAGGAPLPSPPNITAPPATIPAVLQFYDWFARALGANPPPPDNAAFVDLWQEIKVSNGVFNYSALSPAAITGLSAAPTAGEDAIASYGIFSGSQVVNQWSYPAADTGRFGNNFRQRAQTAKSGYLALIPAEAVYFSTSRDSTGQPLSGSNSYVLDLVPPPNGAFWSLTVYNASDFFLPQGLTQYAVGDRSGLVANAIGTYTIYAQPTNPGNRTNWQQTPPGTPIYFILRAYLPPLARIVPSIYAPTPFVRVG